MHVQLFNGARFLVLDLSLNCMGTVMTLKIPCHCGGLYEPYRVAYVIFTEGILPLNLCMLDNFSCFCCCLLISFKTNFKFLKKSFKSTFRLRV